MGTDTAVSIARQFSEQVRKKYPVDKVYLFGSYAKNRAHEGSDIDICVVSPVFKEYSDETEMDVIRMAMKIDTRISPILSNPEDITDRWSQLAHEITTYGIQIV